MSNGNDIKERKGDLGIHHESRGVTNDPFQQQIENDANQRHTEQPSKTTGEGEPFVDGQTYRVRDQPTQLDQVRNHPREKDVA
jgi:hypothetical protein